MFFQCFPGAIKTGGLVSFDINLHKVDGLGILNFGNVIQSRQFELHFFQVVFPGQFGAGFKRCGTDIAGIAIGNLHRFFVRSPDRQGGDVFDQIGVAIQQLIGARIGFQCDHLLKMFRKEQRVIAYIGTDIQTGSPAFQLWENTAGQKLQLLDFKTTVQMDAVGDHVKGKAGQLGIMFQMFGPLFGQIAAGDMPFNRAHQVSLPVGTVRLLNQDSRE